MISDGFPHVPNWQRGIVERFGEHLTNTGGNSPLDLLNDLHDPALTGKLVDTNLPRFVLAVAVDSQVSLLSRLESKGLIGAD